MRLILFFIFVLIGNIAYSYNLKITEVYFAGYHEWIEVFNNGQNFSGSIIISGAKSSNVRFDSISINSGEKLIFGDDLDSIDYQNSISGLSLSISDTQTINIDLYASGSFQDNFYVDSGRVKNLDNQEKSFVKVFSGNDNYISGAKQENNTNLTGDITANPGFVKILTGENNLSGNNFNTGSNNTGNNLSGNINTGNNSKSFSTGDLLITEVFPVDNQFYPEFISLKSTDNISGSFYTKGFGRGDNQNNFDINLLSGEKIYLFDEYKNLSISGYNVKKLENTVSLSDSGEDIYLYNSGNLIDKISYRSLNKSKSLFSTGNEINRNLTNKGSPSIGLDFSGGKNCNLNFQRNNNNVKVNLTGINDYFCSYDYFDIIWKQNGSLLNGNDENLCTKNINLSTGNNEIKTILKYNSKNLCETSKNIFNFTQSKNNNFWSGSLEISEIYPFDGEKFHEYIELTANGNFSGTVDFYGLGWGDSKMTFDITMYDGNRKIITDNLSGYSFTGNTILLDTISLTNGGEKLEISRQNGQVLDKAFYNLSGYNDKSKSFYFSTNSGDTNVFNNISNTTPGLNKEKLKLLNTEEKNNYENNDCYIKLQNNNDEIFDDNSINLISVLNGEEISNSEDSYSCFWNLGNRSIEKCNPTYFDYDSSGIHNIELFIYQNDKKLCETKTFVNYPEKPDLSCKEDYYENLYNKRKEKAKSNDSNSCSSNYNNSSDENNDSSNSEQEETSKTSNYVNIKIKSILPNPEGRDYGKEEITFKLLSGNKADLSNFHMFYSNRTKDINGTLTDSRQTLTLSGSFLFPNRPTCIILKHNGTEKIEDKFCYKSTPDDETISKSIKSMESIENSFFFSNISLDKSYDKICLFYENEDIFCEDIPKNKNEDKNQESIKSDTKNKSKENTKKYSIKIDKVLPNPQGKDSDKEKLVLKNNSDKILDIKGIKLSYGRRDFQIEKSNYLKPGEKISLHDKFKFYNRTSCIYLDRKNLEKTKFCYLNPQAGERKNTSKNFLTKLKDLSIMSNFHIKMQQEKDCMLYEDTEIFCKKNDIIEDIKEENDQLLSKNETLNKEIKEKQNKNNNLEKENTTLSQKNKLYKKFSDYIFDKIQDNWYLVYKEGNFKNLKESLKLSLDKLKNGQKYMMVNYIKTSIFDFEEIDKLKNGEIPLTKSLEYGFNKFITSNLPKKLQKFVLNN